jgi:hypothetical protein
VVGRLYICIRKNAEAEKCGEFLMLQPGKTPHVGIEHLPLNPYAHCNFGHLAIAIVIFPVASIHDHQSPPTTSKTPPPYKKADTTKPLYQQKR